MNHEYELIGDDCQVVTAEPDTTELTGDGTQTLDALAGGAGNGKGLFLVTAKGATSFFPAALNVGEIMPCDGSEVLGAGDTVRKMLLEVMGDASGWNASVSRAEVGVTRLCHKWNKYRFGKSDMTLTISSITTLGVSDKAEGTLGRTFKLFKKEADGTITISTPEDKPVYFIGYIRETDLPGETNAFIFAQIMISASGVGGSLGSAQSHDLACRLTGQDPVFYSIDIPMP